MSPATVRIRDRVYTLADLDEDLRRSVVVWLRNGPNSALTFGALVHALGDQYDAKTAASFTADEITAIRRALSGLPVFTAPQASRSVRRARNRRKRR